MNISDSLRFSIKTLGCKLNRYESDQIASGLVSRGWHEVPFGYDAEIVVIHTCTVTDNSDRKCRNYIRQGARTATNGKVIVTGCLGRRDPAGISEMKEVAAVVGTSGETLAFEIERVSGYDSGAIVPSASVLPRGRVRASIKIQDGCDGSCSYCIVPSVRGKPVSRPFADIIAHVKECIRAGIPEIVFTGITIGKYSDGDRDLADLAGEVLSLDGDFRVRITSIEPRHASPRLVSLFGHPKLCNHIHLPLQSGSDAVLVRMNRPYTSEEYLSAVRAFRTQLPDIAIGTDIIVGYPGETDEDFARTIAVVKESRFSYVHQFTYSPRGGTVSSREKECYAPTVAERAGQLKALSAELAECYRRGFKGKTLLSVIEQESDGRYFGLTSNYLKVYLDRGTDVQKGKILPVKVRVADDELTGSIELED